MKSPARRHFEQAQAAHAAAETSAGTVQTGDQYELMMAALFEARRTLKDIQSVSAKIEKKRELLPQFEPYIAGVLSAGNGAQDNVLMTVMVWLFDIGDLEGGLDIAEYALQHGLETPDQYKRSTAALVAEQVAEEILRLVDTDGADNPLLSKIGKRALALTEGADMHDQIRAKLHKAIGNAQRRCGEASGSKLELENALEHFRLALALHDRVGVKKDIERLERQCKQAANDDSQTT